MSVLLIGATGELATTLIARLVAQDDEVRVIERDERVAEQWRALGAHVARGDSSDADLVERAAQNARTIVVLDEAVDWGPILQGAEAAAVGRLVVLVSSFDEREFEGSSLDLVALVVPRTRLARRHAVSVDAIARAIDAADDLAGNPNMFVNLGDPSQWRSLGLDAPG